ncbi:MAG: TIGR03668 family PPOX class F420-dependent oxidoreductase [Chloroflexota bacterium]
MEQGEARRRFEGGRVGRMATIRADRTPDLVPIVFALEGDLVYSAVDPKPKTGRELVRLRNIRAEPRVQLLVDEYSEDWRRLWWVRADGIARVVGTGPERALAIELLRAKYPQYATLVGDFGPAIVVKVVRWTGWEFTPTES